MQQLNNCATASSARLRSMAAHTQHHDYAPTRGRVCFVLDPLVIIMLLRGGRMDHSL